MRSKIENRSLRRVHQQSVLLSPYLQKNFVHEERGSHAKDDGHPTADALERRHPSLRDLVGASMACVRVGILVFTSSCFGVVENSVSGKMMQGENLYEKGITDGCDI